MVHFDYIIAGAGCAGRSLAVRLIPYLRASNKRLLLLDVAPKKKNDRTWCFWEKSPDIFESIVCKKWNRLAFAGQYINYETAIEPYQYKMVKGEDFYAYTDKLVSTCDHISEKYGNITGLYNKKDKAYVTLDGEKFSADYIFSSIPQSVSRNANRYQYFLQHFEGWLIQTEKPVFDADCATLMDFNTTQSAGTSFVYVLPLSANRALIEYTVFSEFELSQTEYNDALEKYIRLQLNCGSYEILEREHGVIPMSDHPLKKRNGRIIYMGTAGGFTKGSTGYTFQFIQKHTQQIADQLSKNKTPFVKKRFSRFNTYDSTLLYLLKSERISGEEIFSTMFKNNKVANILKFLDNETSLLEELKIFSTLNKTEFALAFLKRW